MTDSVLNLLIVDDHPLFRQGLTQLLRTENAFHVVGEAASGRDGLAAAARLQPDVVLLDLNMKDMSGLEVLQQLQAGQPDIKVIMVTVSDQSDDLVRALRSGASGYLLKDMEPEAMLEAIHGVAAGRVIVSETLVNLMAEALRNERRPGSVSEAGLTEQEQRILERIAVGLSNKLIARDLNIAEGTVKVHVKHILRKLGLRSRVEAAVWAVARQRNSQPSH